MNISISAKVEWMTRNDQSFLQGEYSREHQWKLENGNAINISSSAHIVPVPYSNTNFLDPELALICSLASCHMLFFLSMAAKKKLEVIRYSDIPKGLLAKNQSNKLAITNIMLQPEVIFKSSVPKEREMKLHHLAHANCFIAQSLHSKIEIKPI